MAISVDTQKYIEFESREYQANWYAINTNPKCEDMVYHILSSRSFEVFLPKIPKKSKSKAFEPLFPGYLFVKLNRNSHDWVKIKHLQGVRKILSFGSCLVPIPDKIIASIRQNIRDDDCTIELPAFRAGDKVRFTKGPFEGLEGIFSGEISGKERMRVLLKAICSWTFMVEVSAVELSNAN